MPVVKTDPLYKYWQCPGSITVPPSGTVTIPITYLPLSLTSENETDTDRPELHKGYSLSLYFAVFFVFIEIFVNFFVFLYFLIFQLVILLAVFV
jgi:hypothetical protein